MKIKTEIKGNKLVVSRVKPANIRQPVKAANRINDALRFAPQCKIIV